MHAQASLINQSSDHTPIITFSTGSILYLGGCQRNGQPTKFPDVGLVVTCFGATRDSQDPTRITDTSQDPFTFTIPQGADWISCNFGHVPQRHNDITAALDGIRKHVSQGHTVSIHCLRGTHRAQFVCAYAISSLTLQPFHQAFLYYIL